VNLDSILFAGWLPIARVLVVGVCGYVFLLTAVRVAGPRTLAKTNVFDFIILVSIGSVYGRILTAKDVALAEAFVAYAFIVGIHYLVSWLRMRSVRLASLLDAEPSLLFYRGRYLTRAMRQARIRVTDLEAAARGKGHSSLESVAAIILEADGTLSIDSTGDERSLGGLDPRRKMGRS
jgi:uncharacterized membrane protein YcaP (DUF421 family)